MPLTEAVNFFASEAEHRSYPVVDERGRLLGLVSRTDALRWQVADRPKGRSAKCCPMPRRNMPFPRARPPKWPT